MIKGFLFEDFKSFQRAELFLEDISILIGANASGKSNVIEGIEIPNLSAVLNALCEEPGKKETLLDVIRKLPENEIRNIGFFFRETAMCFFT